MTCGTIGTGSVPTSIVTGKPFWDYILVAAGFGIATWGVAWSMRDQWRHRYEPTWRLSKLELREGRRRPGLVWRAQRWWSRRAHRVLAIAAAPLFAFFATATSLVIINSIVYAVVTNSGLPRC